MALEQWSKSLALKLQEAATQLSQSDVCRRLRDALDDACPNSYCYVCDVYGDDQSGDVVYQMNGECYMASYEFASVNGTSVATIDTEHASEVMPRTVYDPMPDDADAMAAMEAEKLYAGIPTSERYISQSKRKSMPAEDFAGKNRSFPVSTQADLDAAFSSLGRAGAGNYSISTIRDNLIKIAKRKGLKLPKSAQEAARVVRMEQQLTEAGARHSAADMKAIQAVHDNATALGAMCPAPTMEAQRDADQKLNLRENLSDFLEPVELREAARSDYPVKIIAPGKGSSAFYTSEVLKSSAHLFKPGLHLYWNHPTLTEESDRPERNIDHLAAVLTETAHWEEAGPKGPGLYSRAKVFSDHAQQVEEKGPYIGLSILAAGNAEKQNGMPVMREGVPLLKEFTYVASTDFVTKAGAGGMPIVESAADAAPIQTEEDADNMAANEELTKLIEGLQLANEGLKAANARNATLSQRLARTEAREAGAAKLKGIRLPDDKKAIILERAVSAAPMTADGDLDTEAFMKVLESEIQHAAALLGGGPIVTGMGTTQPTEITESDRKAQELREREEADRHASIVGFPTSDKAMARKILERGRSAFDPNYNSAMARRATAVPATGMELN